MISAHFILNFFTTQPPRRLPPPAPGIVTIPEVKKVIIQKGNTITLFAQHYKYTDLKKETVRIT